MATTTVGAKFAIVNVIGSVTIYAAGTNFLHGSQRAAMTICTGDVHVCALQQKTRLNAVIKQPEIPGDRVMAGFAGIRKCSVVIIVFKMTADTIVSGIDKDLGIVAILTFDIVVFTEQWKARQIVIKKWCLFPGIFIVAIITLITLGSFVTIVFKVTR